MRVNTEDDERAGQINFDNWPDRGWVEAEEGIPVEWVEKYGREAGGILLRDVPRLIPRILWMTVVVPKKGYKARPFKGQGGQGGPPPDYLK